MRRADFKNYWRWMALRICLSPMTMISSSLEGAPEDWQLLRQGSLCVAWLLGRRVTSLTEFPRFSVEFEPLFWHFAHEFGQDMLRGPLYKSFSKLICLFEIVGPVLRYIFTSSLVDFSEVIRLLYRNGLKLNKYISYSLNINTRFFHFNDFFIHYPSSPVEGWAVGFLKLIY